MQKRFASALIILLLTQTGSILTSFASTVQAKTGAQTRIATLLEKSGYSYTKLGEGVWEIAFTGKNLKDFSVRVALGDDLIVVISKIADRKDLVLKEPLLTKLLELNDEYDSVKVALDKDMLYARIDTHENIVDENELKYMIEQISAATDQTYPHIKPYLKATR